MTRVAITGGSGFVGGHLATRLRERGHEVVPLSRQTGFDLSAGEPAVVADALAGCDAVVHCAGINREIGRQTYHAVHVRGTETVLEAARLAGVRRFIHLSFLRARPDGTTAYHRSKWAAEELVRGSGLAYTVFKAGVIYGRGDHMLDHTSRALSTVPVFGLVGFHDSPLRPVAVDDVARLLEAAALGDDRFLDRTVAVLGPESITLGDATRRIATVLGRRVWLMPMPVVAHVAMARVAEWAMRVPLLSVAQVHILAEGVVEPLPVADPPPHDLAPQTAFTVETIRAGLPPAGGFGRSDLRWCAPRR